MADKIDMFLESINLKLEYLQRFKDSGYDDLDLIKSLTDQECQEMFTLVGMSAKPGHILKFKKALSALLAKQTETVDKSTPTSSELKQTKVQTSKCIWYVFIPHVIHPWAVYYIKIFRVSLSECNQNFYIIIYSRLSLFFLFW